MARFVRLVSQPLRSFHTSQVTRTANLSDMTGTVIANHLDNVKEIEKASAWKKPPPINHAVGRKWRRMTRLELKYQTIFAQISRLRKELGLDVSDEALWEFRIEALQKLQDDEENRHLTEMSMRHTRYDPSGDFTQMDFERKQKTPKKSRSVKITAIPEDSEEDRWLTERSREWAKNA